MQQALALRAHLQEATQTTSLTSALPSAWQKMAYSRAASLACTAMAADVCTAANGERQ